MLHLQNAHLLGYFFLRCYEKGCIALDEINFVELRFALVTHRLTNPLRGLVKHGNAAWMLLL